ncbi:MAG: GNAT family N-acetyltransferase [Bifidobacteriaceae bacterium]|nr:GNAT family N-acetyltransferase [Bifidobacteriaceae bacterium]
MSGYTRPRPIRVTDDLRAFDSGHPMMDRWLRQRALANEAGRASRTFVTAPVSDPGTVVGYYALAAGSVGPGEVPGRVRRNMPRHIPVVVLARLAVSLEHQGRGLGSELLVDAAGRAVAAGIHVGVRAMVVHVLDTRAATFYERLGFVPALPGGLTYVAAIDDLIRTLVR